MSNYLDPNRNLAILFEKFEAYRKLQAAAGAYEKPVYTGQEDSKVNKHYEIEKQLNDERGQHY